MTEQRVSEVRTTQQEPEREQRIFTFKATQLVWLFFGVLEALIALRIGLKLFGANPASPVATFLYAFTDLFLRPFTGLLGRPQAAGFVLELSSVVAMVVYALIAWALERLIWVIFYRPRGGPVVGVTQTTSTDQRTGLRLRAKECGENYAAHWR